MTLGRRPGPEGARRPERSNTTGRTLIPVEQPGWCPPPSTLVYVPPTDRLAWIMEAEERRTDH